MSGSIRILDLKFKPYISVSDIEIAVNTIALKIESDYSDSSSPPLFISILNGSFVFASDLLRKLKIPCHIEFVRLKSYEGTSSSENMQEIIGLNTDIENRDLIIIEDIVDTGNTLDTFVRRLESFRPRSIRIASLVFKKHAFQKDFEIHYLGFEIENKFIVGYGLDYNEYGRNLPEIYQIV